jgi:hypothetical protein
MVRATILSRKTHSNIVTLNNMSANTFNDIIKYSESLTPDEQLRLATILIENVCKTRITIHHPVWQKSSRICSIPQKKGTTFLELINSTTT